MVCKLRGHFIYLSWHDGILSKVRRPKDCRIISWLHEGNDDEPSRTFDQGACALDGNDPDVTR